MENVFVAYLMVKCCTQFPGEVLPIQKDSPTPTRGGVRFPFLGVIFVDDIILLVAIEQVDNVASRDRETQICVQTSQLGNLRAANRKNRMRWA